MKNERNQTGKENNPQFAGNNPSQNDRNQDPTRKQGDNWNQEEE
ncbi:hypothetical protein [Aequorivita aquimaris]|nr:hypothetical protein [Aequorivita aquimaris]